MLMPKCEKFNIIYEENYSDIEKVELTPREIEVIQLVEGRYKKGDCTEIEYSINYCEKTYCIVLLKT